MNKILIAFAVRMRSKERMHALLIWGYLLILIVGLSIMGPLSYDYLMDLHGWSGLAARIVYVPLVASALVWLIERWDRLVQKLMRLAGV